jgi:chromosome segregation ATPase
LFSIADDRLEEIFRLLTAIHLQIQNISRRLSKLERKQQYLPVTNENEEDLVTELLPLKTTDEITNFDQIIRDSAIAASQFVSFLFYIITILLRVNFI